MSTFRISPDRIPGRYTVKRDVVLDGGTICVKEIECNNPAYGERVLDEWQTNLMESRRPPPASEIDV